MVKTFGRRILLYPAAAMLFGTMVLPASFAREHSHLKSARGLAHHVAPGSAKKGEVNIPISVQHGGGSDHDHAAAGPKTFKIVPSNHVHGLATKPPAGPSVIGRNAIGLPIVGHEVVQPDNALSLSRLQAQPSGLPTSGLSSFPNRNPATTHFMVSPTNPPPPNLSSGRIDGAALIRRPAVGVGGPSTPIGGINGTAFAVRKR